MNLSFRHEMVLHAKRWIYAGRGEPYTINGRTLRYVPGSRPVRLHYKDSQNAITRFDALQLQALLDGIKDGDTVIDIGGHYGQYSIVMAALCGQSGNVITFEPDPYARDFLKRNLALNPSLKPVVIEESALSDTDGFAVLFSKGGNSQSSLVRSAVEFDEKHCAEPIQVRTVCLDTYLQQNTLPTPSWIKIDCEGAEIRVLKGAQKVLAGPAKVLCELHPYAWEAFGNTFDDLMAIVSAPGWRMHYLGTTREVLSNPDYGIVMIDHLGR
jgi:FkbM family methyltransferase